MDCSKPGLPVHHQLPEFTQTHTGDAIQPSHPLSSPSPPAFNLSQHQGLFQWITSSHQVAKVLEFQLQHQSFQWIFRTDFLQDGLVGSPCCPRDSQESSPRPQFKSINSSVLSFLYSLELPRYPIKKTQTVESNLEDSRHSYSICWCSKALAFTTTSYLSAMSSSDDPCLLSLVPTFLSFSGNQAWIQGHWKGRIKTTKKFIFLG